MKKDMSSANGSSLEISMGHAAYRNVLNKTGKKYKDAAHINPADQRYVSTDLLADSALRDDAVNRNSAEHHRLTLADRVISTDFQHLTNKELLSKCKEYGREALQWKWKFAGLLPEVNRRGLWKEAGFESVFHFAKVLAGMSEAQVKQALRLERKFENMPKLRVLFEEGKVSPNKLDRIGSVVTEENEEELATLVQMHSKQAVATLVKDVQRQSLPGQSMIGTYMEKNATLTNGTEGNQTLCNPVGDIAATPGLPGIAARLGRDEQSMTMEERTAMSGDTWSNGTNELQLSQELKSRLLKLKEKGFDINDLLMELLDAREETIEEEKEAIAQEIEKKEELEYEMWQGCPPHLWHGEHEKLTVQRNGGNGGGNGGRRSGRSRYVNARTRRVLKAEFGSRCSIETCKKPAQELHHTRRFSLAPNNNPKFLAPLCKAHHELAAMVDVRYFEHRKKESTSS